MEYSIENDCLKLTVTTWGAQMKSVVRKCDNVEHIWQADREVWGYHAPIYFPYCGKVLDGKFEAKGRVYTTGENGFAKYMEHQFLQKTSSSVTMELLYNRKILKKFPYKFRLISSFVLEGNSIKHTVTVENLDEVPMPFGIGFSPAFRIPFDEQHDAADYALRFSSRESPICLNTHPHGLLHGNVYLMPTNISAIPISESLFQDGGHCMVNLRSKTMGLYEKDTGRGVICEIGEFPFTTIWSPPGTPKFISIAPSFSLPSPERGSIQWEEKPAAAILAPGKAWCCTLRTSYIR